jgi:DNA-binding response OmpR family regulator
MNTTRAPELLEVLDQGGAPLRMSHADDSVKRSVSRSGGSRPLVLAVDDDAPTLKLLHLAMENDGYRLITADSGRQALRLVSEKRPDLMLLDIGLPDTSGLDVMRAARELSAIPIILLTGLGRDADKVRGLNLGADDYISKPFNLRELSARVGAVIRRYKGATPAAVKVGELEIDLSAGSVMISGRPISLTPTEWKLLTLFVSNRGKLLTSGEILSAVWAPEFRDELQYLRVWMNRLRAKLQRGNATNLVRTFHGVGYMFEPSANAVGERRAEGAAVLA